MQAGKSERLFPVHFFEPKSHKLGQPRDQSCCWQKLLLEAQRLPENDAGDLDGHLRTEGTSAERPAVMLPV